MAVLAGVFRWAYNDGLIDTDPLLPAVTLIVIAFLAGTPVAFVLAAGGALYFAVKGDVPMSIVPAAYQAGIGGFLLLSIPLFMLAGALMDISGMAKRLVDMVQHWVGHWTGGLLMSTVGATYMFSMVSGVKAADISTVGTIMRKPMREHGYPSTEFAGVLAASVAMADSVPPSVAMLILGSVSTLSVGALFIAGFFPAAILALALLVAVAIRSRVKGFRKGPPFDARRAFGSIPGALPALGVPIIVIGALVGGIASPTEAASFAVVYAAGAVAYVHRTVKLRTAWPAIRDATLVSGMVLVMIGTAHLLVQAIVIAGLGRTLAEAFAFFNNPTVFLLISVLALVVIGFVLEGFPAILVTAPILLPVAERMGVDPLQFGMLLLVAIGIGVMMPPVGLGYYITCAVTGAPVNATMRPSWIYNVFLILGLFVVALVPEITLWLPRQLGLHGIAR
jgi:tripartite ATP-independent transporter DctM subunit